MLADQTAAESADLMVVAMAGLTAVSKADQTAGRTVAVKADLLADLLADLKADLTVDRSVAQ